MPWRRVLPLVAREIGARARSPGPRRGRVIAAAVAWAIPRALPEALDGAAEGAADS